jgi:hypothetical protein
VESTNIARSAKISKHAVIIGKGAAVKLMHLEKEQISLPPNLL